MKKIKILIPIYNDWKSVFKLLENINSEISTLDNEFSVIIINDASNEKRPELSFNVDNIRSIKVINMKKAIIVLFIAMWFLSFIFISSVKLKKKGTFPIVSIATKKSIKEFIKVAVIWIFHTINLWR